MVITDCLIIISADKWNSEGAMSTKLASQPCSLSLSGGIEDYAIVGCQKEVSDFQ